MGFLSKLINDVKKGDLESLKNTAQKLAQEAIGGKPAAQTAQPAAPQPAAAPQPEQRDHSGRSWGDLMPAEENQYSFNGGYIAYFEKIFREDFGAYTVTGDNGANGRCHIYTFTSGGRKALIVELKSDFSAVQRFRRAAEAEGVPYVRFYYDHPGWWNTRSYVKNRIQQALRG